MHITHNGPAAHVHASPDAVRARAHTHTHSRHTQACSQGAGSEGAAYSEASGCWSTSRALLAPEGARYTQHALHPAVSPLSPSRSLRLVSLFQRRWHGTPGAYRRLRLARVARVCAACVIRRRPRCVLMKAWAHLYMEAYCRVYARWRGWIIYTRMHVSRNMCRCTFAWYDIRWYIYIYIYIYI
jgi:hypothetical protein